MNKTFILVSLVVSGLLLTAGSMTVTVLSHAALPEEPKSSITSSYKPDLISKFVNNGESEMQVELPASPEAAGIPYDWKYGDYQLWSYKSAGDVNGDGYDDVIVGFPYYNVDPNQGNFERGKVLVFHGSAGGLNSNPNWTEVFTPTQGAHFGSSVNTAGDVNYDGYDDVIIGAEYYQDTTAYQGAAYVYYGSSGGLSANPSWSYKGDAGNFFFGRSVSTAGDVNNDGYDDILVGAPGYPEGSDNNGIVYLFLGSSSGPSTSPDWSKEGGTIYSEFGDIVATAGHVNNDVYADIIVGAFMQGPGIVRCFGGTASGLTADPIWSVNGEIPPLNGYYSHFGRYISSAGDINNDGYDDVIVGAPEYYYQPGASGKVYVYYGSSSGLPYSPSWTAVGNSPAQFGWYVSTAGDVNGDDYSDVIVGAPSYNTNWGRVFVYYGSSLGLETSPAWTVDGDRAYTNLGGGAVAGDVNNDGNSDLLFHGSGSDGKPTVYSIYGEAEVAISGLFATSNSPTPIGGTTTLTATITAGSFVKYAWSFGDGQTGTGQVVAHSYQATGIYTAIVTATNHLGSQVATTLVDVRCDCCSRLNNAPAYYPSIQAAVDASTSASDVVKVAGTCKSVNNRGGLAQIVYLDKSLTIEGGYTVTNWTTPDLIANPTTLDAQGQGRVLYITGNISPKIEGLRLTGGDAVGLGGGPPGLDAGGGLFIITATTNIRNCEIDANQADYAGGLTIAWSPTTLQDNRIHDNVATGGVGGVDVYYSSVALVRNTIENNSAGSGFGGNGGGLAGLSSYLTLTGNTIISNTALYYNPTDEGGFGGGLFLSDGSVVTMTDNIVAGNIAGVNAGGFYGEHGNYTFMDNQFSGNSAVESGGGVAFFETEASLINTVIANNQASEGGGLSAQDALIHLSHSTFTGNSASGIAIVPPESVTGTTVFLTNTILVDHSVGISITSGNTLTVNAILWDASTPVTVSQEAGTVVSIQNQQVGNPAFAPDGYHLTVTSNAIDQGVVSGVGSDIDGELRPLGGSYDLGVDEFPEQIPLSGSGSTSTADGSLTFTWTLAQPITITYASQLTTTNGIGDFEFAGMVFHLEATDQNGNPISTPTTPLTLTIHYNDADLPAGILESELMLNRYNEDLDKWLPLTILNRDLDANTLMVLLDHFSEFALLVPAPRLYLPIVLR